jgi:hypothetical protein
MSRKKVVKNIAYDDVRKKYYVNVSSTEIKAQEENCQKKN